LQNQNAPSLVLSVKPFGIDRTITRLVKGPFKYEYINGQKFVPLGKTVVDKRFRRFTINSGICSLRVLSSPDYLTPSEIIDVEASLQELKEGKGKKFTNVDEFLKELKT
jgi:hypothetical protein